MDSCDLFNHIHQNSVCDIRAMGSGYDSSIRKFLR